MKWISRIIAILLIFLGLYFFGDFEINRVNVKAKLQAWIPPQKMGQIFKDVGNAIANGFGTIQETLSEDSGTKAPKIQPQNAELDKISEQDQESMKKLLREIVIKETTD